MDLAEQIDDFIPSVQASHSDMDSLIMLIFILFITSLLLLWLGRFLYQKYVTNKAVPATNSTTGPVTTTTTGIQKSSTPVNSTTPTAASSKYSAFSFGSSGGGARRGSSGGTPINSSPISASPASQGLGKGRALSQQPQLASSGVRKRLTRRSPGPELQPRRSRSVQPPSSVTGPDDTTVQWASQVFKWLYSDLVIVNDLLYGFITAINQTMARNTSEEKILIEVVRILPESTTPNISNIFCDKAMTDAASEVIFN